MGTEASNMDASARRWRDAAGRCDRISRLSHWVLGVLMIGMLASGLALGYLPVPGALSGGLRDWHKAMGVVVLAFGTWRVGWRLIHGFPEGAAMPAWQERAAKVAHWALLAAIVVMPLSGVVMTLFAGRSISVLGLTMPGASEVSWLASMAEVIHAVGGVALAALVAVHVAGALKHHLVDRDDTLRRMLHGAHAPSPRLVTDAQPGTTF